MLRDLQGQVRQHVLVLQRDVASYRLSPRAKGGVSVTRPEMPHSVRHDRGAKARCSTSNLFFSVTPVPYPRHVPLAKLLLSSDSTTSLLTSTVMRNSQSGAKQPRGIGKARSTDAPGARAGVGWSAFPYWRKSTCVVEEPAPLVPYRLCLFRTRVPLDNY